MKTNKNIIALLLLSISVIANAQITKSAADSLVLNMLNNDTTIAVYTIDESMGSNVSIYTAVGDELTSPYDNSYIYFIDDIPMANWAHSCRYCFVNSANGNTFVINQDCYPDDFKSYTLIGQQPNRDIGFWPYTNYTIPTKATPNSKLYAVLIAGAVGSNDDIKTWYNLSCVYTALVNKYGFMEPTNNSNTHIYVIASSAVTDAVYNSYNGIDLAAYDLNQSGDFDNILDFINLSSNDISYSKDGIKEIFDNLSGYDNTTNIIPELTEDDQLFVFLCGETYKTSTKTGVIISNGHTPVCLYEDDLANWVRNIKCSQMTFLIDCNNAGEFIDDLMTDGLAECKNRAVHTSTDQTHLSWVEQHMAAGVNTRGGGGGGNDSNRIVDEYVYYWSAASLGYYPILELHSDAPTGPWYKYGNTTIGSFLWDEFGSFDEGNGYSHTGYDVNPNTNSDGVLSMEEAFRFADNLDSYSRRGYFHPKEMFYNNGQDTCVEYPCHAYESSFTKELITLSGYKGTVGNSAATGTGHKYILSGGVYVEEDTTLIITNNTLIEGGSQSFINRGNLVTDNNLSNATFHRVNLLNSMGSLSLSNCVFDTCGIIETIDGPFSITNSTLNETSVLAHIDEMPRDPYNVVITNDTFNISSDMDAIVLRRIPQCNVSGNVITTGGNGIYLNRLSGTYTSNLINNNTISNCGGSGILSYASNGSLYGNAVTDNDVDGLQSLNLSGLYVTGNNMAFSRYETQRFINNDRYQVHASNNSYPDNFHYNWLCGNGTSSDYILFFESNYPQGNHPKMFDVSYNCWYPLSDSNIPGHLLSSGNTAFSYLPTWSANGTLGIPDRSGSMLAIANGLVETGDYDMARDWYMHLIEDYPESFEAVAAMKALFSIEVEADGDFTALKDYYLGLVSDDYLGGLADNLANRCDVEIGNYSDAVRWYENKLTDPDAMFSERIFAEIDLGDLYIEMADNGMRGLYGSLAEYVPASKEAHAERTRYLLSLLPGDIGQDRISESAETHLICSPNPANNKITVSYTLDTDTDAEICLYDVSGRVVRRVKLGKQCGGSHSYELDLSDLSDGLYFCRINADRQNNDFVKIIINH